MANVFARIRTLVLDVPRHGKLAYCLVRDQRVPMAPKLALAGALGIVVSPLDLPNWIPVVGELDMLALGILAVKVFIEACPDQVVSEHEQAIASGTSVFDEDRRQWVAVAKAGVVKVVEKARGGRDRPRLLEDRSA